MRSFLLLFFQTAALSLCLSLWPGRPLCAAPLLAPQPAPDTNAAALQLLLEDIGKQRHQVVAIQRELVARPALNPTDGGQGELSKALWIEEYLRANNLPLAERYDVPDERVADKVRPNLIIRYPGASERTLWLIAHMDTSPAGDLAQWKGSPWVLRVDGDTLYGRGVEDNHQAVVSGLILLNSLQRNKITPPLSLGMVIVSGEKDPFFSRPEMADLLKSRWRAIRPDDLIVVNDFGNDQGSLIEVGEKGALWLRLRISGWQQHAARPRQGPNALEAGLDLMLALRALPDLFPLRDELFNPPRSTFTFTKVEESRTAMNQTPGEFVLYMDCRLLAPYTAEDVEKAVRGMALAVEKEHGTRIAVERVAALAAGPNTSPEAPVVRALRRAARAQLGVEASMFGMGGVTLATGLRSAGFPVAVWAKADSEGGNPNEKISITGLLDAGKVFARILFDAQAAGGGPQP